VAGAHLAAHHLAVVVRFQVQMLTPQGPKIKKAEALSLISLLLSNAVRLSRLRLFAKACG